jgi:3-oxoacyl-[acyl-carrier protein] reductase
VIVTGGARGIGGEIASRFASEGARVGILDRLVAEGNERAGEIGGSFHEVDLADPDSTIESMHDALSGLGGIDILVNSAGIFQLSPLLDISIDDWDLMFDINARAMLTTMQVTARAIVNLSSMAAKKGGAQEAHYAASKAAVVALTRAAAIEWGSHGIRANAICPGYVLTAMGAATRTDAQIAEWSKLSPLGRLATPADVAGVALFLASSEADYLTGQAINVTGGMVMH